jgi:hypothetical protein
MRRQISSKTLLVVVSGVLLSGAARAAPHPNVNAVVTMDADFFGCQSLGDLARVVNLDWVQNNKEASITYGRQHCIVLHKGDQFKVQEMSVLQGAVCLRQPNSSDCYWTNAQMLKSP